MEWVIFGAIALAVFVLAAFAGNGHLGQMPAEPITDRYKGRIPEWPITPESLGEMVLPRALIGYERTQVDQVLRWIVEGPLPPGELTFDVVRGGYDMSTVDRLLALPRREAVPGEAEEPVMGEDPDDEEGR